MKQVWIVDTTLRDGEQAPGVVFSKKEKIRIAEMLAFSGVNELEIGIPAMGSQEIEAISDIVKLNLPLRLTSWARALEHDIISSAKTGTEAIHISFPVSERHLATLDKSESWVLDQVSVLIKRAKEEFEFVSIGAQDGSRASEAFLMSFLQRAKEAGANRVRFADTVGTLLPNNIPSLFKRMKAVCDITMEFHAHNDLGMATANSMMAIDSGCEAVSVTVGGIGERAGNAALEELVMALTISDQYSTTVVPSKLTELCKYVAGAAERQIPPQKPIVGEAVFQHESGIHCAALLKDPYSYQPFLPELVGSAPTKYIVGKHSGSALIGHILSRYQVSLSVSQAKAFMGVVKEKVSQLKRPLSPEEVFNLYQINNPTLKVA